MINFIQICHFKVTHLYYIVQMLDQYAIYHHPNGNTRHSLIRIMISQLLLKIIPVHLVYQQNQFVVHINKIFQHRAE